MKQISWCVVVVFLVYLAVCQRATYKGNLFESKKYVRSKNKAVTRTLNRSCLPWMRSDTYCYPSDLILYYNMEGITGGSGTPICDKSKYAYDCDLRVFKGANVGFDASIGRNSLNTGGGNNVYSIVNATKIRSAILASGSYTLEIWSRPAGSNNGESIIFAYANSTACGTGTKSATLSLSKFNLAVSQFGTSLRHRLKTNHLSDPSCGATDYGLQFLTNQRRQHVIVFNSTHVQSYVNGERESSEPFEFNPVVGSAARDVLPWSPTFLVSLGNDVDENGGWVGRIDSVAMWKSALSPEQVKKLYESNGAPNSTCVNKIEPFISCAARTGGANSDKCVVLFGYRNYDLSPFSQVLVPSNTNVNRMSSTIAGVPVSFDYPSVFLSGEHLNVFNVSNIPCSLLGGGSTQRISWSINSDRTYGASTVSTSDIHVRGLLRESIDQCLPIYQRSCAFPRIAHDNGATSFQSSYAWSQNLYTVSRVSVPSATSRVFRPLAIGPSITPVDYYGYNSPVLSSSNTGLEALIPPATVWITVLDYSPTNWTRDTNQLYVLLSYGTASTNQFSGSSELVVSIDKNNGRYTASYFPLQALDDASSVADWYTWDSVSFTLRVRNTWPSCTNDGLVIGPINSCINISFALPGSSLGFGSIAPSIGIVSHNSSTGRPQFVRLVGHLLEQGIRVCPLCDEVPALSSPPGPPRPPQKPCGDTNSACPEIQCVYYDQCGRCNGDNSTCPWARPDPCCDTGSLLLGGNWTFDSTATCNVSSVDNSTSKDQTIIITATGTFVQGVTSVIVRIECPSNASLQNSINSLWAASEPRLVYSLPNGRRVLSRDFSMRVRFEQLKSCLGVEDGVFSDTTFVSTYGIVNITSFFIGNRSHAQLDSIISSYLSSLNMTTLSGYLSQSGSSSSNSGSTNTIHYFVPCKFRIRATRLASGSDCVSIKYTTSKIDPPEVQVIKQLWTVSNGSDESCNTVYKNMITVFETCIRRPFGFHTRLVNATMLPYYERGNGRVSLLFGSPCVRNGRMDPLLYCCQQWAMTTTDADHATCLDYRVAINFTIQMSERPYPVEPPLGSDWYLLSRGLTKNFGSDTVQDSSTVLVIRETTCKPSECTDIVLPGGAKRSCNVTYGLYADPLLTRQTDEFLECQRIYLKMEADCGDGRCDSVDLQLVWARFCTWSSDVDEDGVPSWCDEQNANIDTFVIADASSGYLGPPVLQTSLSTVPGSEQCSGKLLISWIAPYVGDKEMLIHVKYKYGQEIREASIGGGGAGGSRYLVSNAWSLSHKDSTQASGLEAYSGSDLARLVIGSSLYKKQAIGSQAAFLVSDSGSTRYATRESNLYGTRTKSFKSQCKIRCKEDDCTKRHDNHEYHYFGYDHYYAKNNYVARPGWFSILFGRLVLLIFLVGIVALVCVILCTAAFGICCQGILTQRERRVQSSRRLSTSRRSKQSKSQNDSSSEDEEASEMVVLVARESEVLERDTRVRHYLMQEEEDMIEHGLYEQ